MKITSSRYTNGPDDAPVWSLALSPDGRRLASGDNDARVIVWDVATGRSVRHQDSNDGWITAMCFTRDQSRLALGRSDSTVRLLNLADRRYETALGYNQPGRGAYLTVRWQPK